MRYKLLDKTAITSNRIEIGLNRTVEKDFVFYRFLFTLFSV